MSAALSLANISVASSSTAQVCIRLFTWNVAASCRPLIPGGVSQKKQTSFRTLFRDRLGVDLVWVLYSSLSSALALFSTLCNFVLLYLSLHDW